MADLLTCTQGHRWLPRHWDNPAGHCPVCGAIGVKVYPPVGFKPFGNGGSLGGMLDEQMRQVLRFCLTEDVPILAHCSFSPWQIMATNARQFTPLELMQDPEKALIAVVSFLNREILGRQKADTLSEIADAYNSGNWTDANVPQDYIDKLHRNYLVPIPPQAQAKGA